MYTNEQIASLSGKDLVNAYNELADVAQKTHVTRFATRVDGVRRTTNLAEVVRGIAAHAGVAEELTGPLNGAPIEVNPTDALLDEPDAAAMSSDITSTSNVVPLVQPTKKAKTALKRTTVTALKTTAQPKAAKAPRVTVSSRCRELLATHTNEEIFAILQAEFGVDEKKRGYPAWYRADAKRKGK